jgi:serine/threonine-protein kinase PpkA
MVRVFAKLGMAAIAAGLMVSAAAAQARAPMGMDGLPEFYQRVLTLPGAALMAEPKADAKPVDSKVPVFSIFYVFDRKLSGNDTWIEVGKAADGSKTSWIKAVQTQDWEIMLVMQYAPPGQRKPVMFFKDTPPLSKLVQSPKVKAEAEDLLAQIGAGKHDGSLVLAREPDGAKGAVTFEKRPYLMPILGFKRDEFDSGRKTTLLQVASVRATETPAKPADNGQPDLSKMKFGIMLLFDTTNSMGPYIERARRVVRSLYAKLEAKGLSKQTQFGVTGYRNNMDGHPELEYVAQVFQKLDPNARPADVLASLDKVAASKAPTHAWDEDGIAGLHTALTGTDWSPFDVRVILQITDAGMLSANDPKAKLKGVGIPNILDIAKRERVAIFPIHLRTPQADRAGDLPRAQTQYTELGRTGDINTSKYIPIESGSEEAFQAELDRAVDRLANTIETVAKGGPMERPKLDDPAAKPSLDTLLLNEIFSAQQTFIGAAKKTDAPEFKATWAADRDLTNPERLAMTTSVFLTRNQLNSLGQALQRILDAAKDAQLSPQKFFARLQALAAQTATNPDQGKLEDIADSKLLPTYLRLLPYQSAVMSLTEQAWLDKGPSGQQEFIADLDSRLLAYRELNASNKWVDLGAGDNGLQVYPVPLSLLP